MTPLPPGFLTTPLAHRALHDTREGRPENSLAAIRAAVRSGYGIEVDIQPSRDGVPMVFHDYNLSRLTGQTGPVGDYSAAELGQITLINGEEGVPTLAAALDVIAGQVPLLIEVKDQDGAMGPAVGALEAAIGEVLNGYAGPVALMSFNPYSVAALARAAPDRPRGLTSCAYDAENWPLLPQSRRAELAQMETADAHGVSFISHDRRSLSMPRVAALRKKGLAILCWTVRSPAEEAAARTIAQNITFEGYLPAPAP